MVYLSSCANKLRVVVEVILNNLGIKKTKITKNRKRKILTLHERIQSYKEKNKEISERLMAIKWIGNLGSHNSEITREHILNEYEILESVINKLYNKDEKRITKNVKAISKSKGKKLY